MQQYVFKKQYAFGAKQLSYCVGLICLAVVSNFIKDNENEDFMFALNEVYEKRPDLKLRPFLSAIKKMLCSDKFDRPNITQISEMLKVLEYSSKLIEVFKGNFVDACLVGANKVAIASHSNIQLVNLANHSYLSNENHKEVCSLGSFRHFSSEMFLICNKTMFQVWSVDASNPLFEV